MKDPGFRPAEPRPRESSLERRARYYPRPGRLLLVALLLLLAFVGFLAFAVGLVMLLVTRVQEWGWLALGGLGLFVITRGVVFIIGEALTCPLCHGTVMRQRRCLMHEEAFRLWPLSYRASAVLSVLTTLGFRCMYCGTAYRLTGSKRR